MKIYIKLNKEETSKWTSIRTAVLGEGQGLSNDEFAKIILFRGLNAFMEDIHTAIDEMDEDEKQKLLDAAGVVPEEVDLEVPLIPKPDSDEKNENSNKIDTEAGGDSEPSAKEQKD